METAEIKGLKVAESTIVDSKGGRTSAFSVSGFTMIYTGDGGDVPYSGQTGVNTFEGAARMKRHVHLNDNGERLVAERIWITGHPILLELAGKYYVILPGTQLDIGPGVPHSWSGIPLNTLLPNGGTVHGPATMVFQYQEKVQGFSLCKGFEIIRNPRFEQFAGDEAEVVFPTLTQEEILKLPYVWDGNAQYSSGWDQNRQSSLHTTR